MLDGFWLDVKIFMVVEVAVLIVGLVVALIRSTPDARLLPVPDARGDLHGRVPRPAR